MHCVTKGSGKRHATKFTDLQSRAVGLDYGSPFIQTHTYRRKTLSETTNV